MTQMRVRSVTYEADGILSFELVHPSGEALPPFEAGAHLDVRTPGGMSRRYSLCNSPGSTDCYRIAVLHAAGSRGGSRSMHEQVRAGDLLEVAGVHNFFPLDEQAAHSILLAGGIGITPLLAMMERLEQEGRSFELHYCTRTAETTAFAACLASPRWKGRVHVHHDGGVPGQGLNIAELLRQRPEGTHVYFCGPPGFMKAVEAAAAHWPQDAVHCEYFGAEPLKPLQSAGAGGEGAEIVLQKSQRSIRVGEGQTILQALRAAGVECHSSCESGLCGECKLSYVSGTPEHNDYVLSDEEKQHSVLVCCARVAEGPLVLDI